MSMKEKIEALVRAKLETLILDTVSSVLTDMLGEATRKPAATTAKPAATTAKPTPATTEDDMSKYVRVDYGDKVRKVRRDAALAASGLGVPKPLEGRLAARMSVAAKAGIEVARAIAWLRGLPAEELEALGKLSSEAFMKRIP